MNWANRIRSLAVMGIIAAAAIILLAARDTPTGIDAVRARGELVVALPEGPASYYQNSFGPAGFEYELAQDFARELGVRLRIIDAENSQDALDAVARGHADFAGGLALETGNEERFNPSLPVQQVTQMVVCDLRGQAMPANVATLAGHSLVIAKGSHHAAQLVELQKSVPALSWQAVADASDENLLALVHQGQAACAVIDSNAWAFHRHLYPDIRVALELPGTTFFGWMFPHKGDQSLREAANGWLARKQADGTIAALRTRHFAHLQSLTQVDGEHFYQAIRFRLPRYVHDFRTAADHNDLDWRLLAAVSYQESMWDPSAESPTGVQGLMQLTQETADQMGIDDRTDPLASIRGGARYLRQILDQLPTDIPAEDRTWMALAAYNAGIAHVLDARELARKRGRNPNAWNDVRDCLALLKQERWYSQTRYGYARGATQAIVYVRQVRRYYDLLVLASNSSSTHDDMMLAMAGNSARMLASAN